MGTPVIIKSLWTATYFIDVRWGYVLLPPSSNQDLLSTHHAAAPGLLVSETDWWVLPYD